MSDVRVESVEFQSKGVTCAADLYLPGDLQPGERRPAMVLGNGFAYVKAPLALPANYFAQAGYIALAIDYRTFGFSGGEERGQLFPLEEVEDFRNAISYLQTRDDVDGDRIGIWGTSMGGAIVMHTGAVDRRAKVVIAQVPVCDGREWIRALRNTDQWEDLLDALDEDRASRYAGNPSRKIPVTGHGSSGDFAGMLVDAAIVEFMKTVAQNMPGYNTEMTLESLEKIIEFNPTSVIHLIAPRPLQIIAVAGWDMVHPVEFIVDAYEKAREPKELVMMPYDQLGLYVEPGASEALAKQVDFLERHMPVRGTVGGTPARTDFSALQ